MSASPDEPEAWQTNAQGPWATLAAGVTIGAVPGERDCHRVSWPDGEQKVVGHSAVAIAHEKVAELSAG